MIINFPDSVSKNTKIAYQKDWDNFVEYVGTDPVSDAQITDELIQRFLSHGLEKNNLKTMNRKLAAIKFVCSILGYRIPAISPMSQRRTVELPADAGERILAKIPNTESKAGHKILAHLLINEGIPLEKLTGLTFSQALDLKKQGKIPEELFNIYSPGTELYFSTYLTSLRRVIHKYARKAEIKFDESIINQLRDQYERRIVSSASQTHPTQGSRTDD